MLSLGANPAMPCHSVAKRYTGRPREILLGALAALAGCGAVAQESTEPGDLSPTADTRAADPADPSGTQVAQTSAEDRVPVSLWTRKAGSDWPTFLGPGGDSKSPEKGILSEWGTKGLRIVWHKPLGEGYGAPTIAAGRLFQFDRFGDQARLYCLNAETGKQLWQYEYPTEYQDMYGYNNGPRCSPIVDGERVYAYGVDGMLICCRVLDGQRLWKVDTAKDFGVIQNFFGVGSTPVVAGENLIAMVGGSPPESQRVPPGRLNLIEPNGTGIVAFDKRTGQVRYKLADELASYASLKTARIVGRDWCFAFCRGGLVGFEPASGKLDFHFPWRDKSLESVNASVPVVAGDQVFISECYGPGSALLKVSPGKSEVVWQDSERRREKALQTHWNTPVELDGQLYACSGRHTENAELRCVDWSTGDVRWSQRGMSRTSLLWIDGHFVCLGEYGQLWLLKANPDKYEEVAAIDYGDPTLGSELIGEERPVLKYPCWAAPIVSHGLLYLRGDDRLVCLELIPEK
jgi:outer membrane protein assembly factor BamB